MTVSPTRRCLGLPLAALLIYVGAVNSQVVWLFAVAALVIAALPLAVLAPVLACRGARPVLRAPRSEGMPPPLAEDRARAFVGDHFVIDVGNAAMFDRIDIERFWDECGAQWPCELLVDEAGAHLVGDVEGLRGRRQLVRVDLTSDWPLGLVRVTRSVPVAITLLVHPRYRLATGGASGAGFGLARPVGRGAAEDIVGLREFRPGDGRRDIAWLATARRGQLTVVQRSGQSHAAVCLALVLRPDAPAADVTLAAGLAASWAAACHRAGQPWRLWLNDGGPEARHWADAIARLAQVAPSAVLPGNHPDAAITVDAAGITVDGSAPLHMPDGMDPEAALAMASKRL